MLQVPIDKIVPLTAARDTLSKIIADVEAGTPMYIFTKNGKPSVAVVSIDYLQKQVGPIETTKNTPAPVSQPSPAVQPAPAPSTTALPASPEPEAQPTTSPAEPDFWGSVGPAKPVDPIRPASTQTSPSPTPAPPTPPPPAPTTGPNQPSDPGDMDIG